MDLFSLILWFLTTILFFWQREGVAWGWIFLFVFLPEKAEGYSACNPLLWKAVVELLLTAASKHFRE